MRSRRARFKVGVQGSRRRREVVAFAFASIRKSASVRKRRRRVGHAGETKIVAKRRNVVTFGLVSGLRVSTVSTVTGIRGVVVAKRRTVVAFRLVSGLRVSKVSTVTGIRRVLVAKRRIVVTVGLVSGLRVSKVSTVTGIEGVVVAKRRTVSGNPRKVRV